MEKARVFLSLGSNQGDRKAYLEEAVKALKKLPQSKVLHYSSVYETKAWGKTDQEDFYNLTLELETDLSPLELLEQTQRIESELGRVRHEHWGPRTLDIDLLLFGDHILDTPRLKIPHPHMTKRSFVLEPLQQIAGSLKLQGREIGEIVEELGEEKPKKLGELYQEW